MGVRLLGRAMLGQLVVMAINSRFCENGKSYDLARFANRLDPDRKVYYRKHL